MEKIIDFAKAFYIGHRKFLLYGIISVFVTVVDIIACRISENFFSPVVSNTIGVLLGFIIQYFLTARHVYNGNNVRTFVIFLLTFIFSLFLANSIVYLSRTYIFGGADTETAFLISKLFSIVFPFFITYFLRKALIK